jgi:hypothetical protein
VATPLIGAAKALYLDRRGQLPEKREAALTRRIKARFGQAREAVGEAVDEAVEKVREVLPGSG